MEHGNARLPLLPLLPRGHVRVMCCLLHFPQIGVIECVRALLKAFVLASSGERHLIQGGQVCLMLPVFIGPVCSRVPLCKACSDCVFRVRVHVA